jgi:hypothetical protein
MTPCRMGAVPAGTQYGKAAFGRGAGQGDDMGHCAARSMDLRRLPGRMVESADGWNGPAAEAADAGHAARGPCQAMTSNVLYF